MRIAALVEVNRSGAWGGGLGGGVGGDCVCSGVSAGTAPPDVWLQLV